MTNLKRIILFYLIGLLLFLLVSLIFGGELVLILLSAGLWILPAIFSLLGFVIGAIIYQLMLKPDKKKTKIFFISHSTAVVCFIVLAISLQSETRNYKRNFANIERNHDQMKYFVNDNEEYIRVAFNRLESEFKNPNTFRLDAFTVRKLDTLIKGTQDTVYNIYFTYFLGSDKDNKYFSKVSVLGGTPILQLYNLDTRTNDEYIIIKAEKDKMEREVFQSLKESFEQMPESTRNAKNDTLRKALNQ